LYFDKKMKVYWILIISVGAWMTGAGLAGFGQSVEDMQKLHILVLTAAV
jgi:hypothetical protein